MSEQIDPKENRDGSTRETRRLRPLRGETKVAAGPTPVASIDPIDEAGEESFPASDPPTWTLGVDPGAKPSDAKPGDAKPSDTKPGDTKPSHAKPSHSKPGKNS